MAASESDQEACTQLYRDLCAYSVDKDADGLRGLFAPEYELIHMTGMHQSADEYIAAVVDGTLNYYDIHHDAIEVSIDAAGTAAHIRGKSRTLAAVFGGGQHWWNLQQDLKAVKRGGRWLLAESRASTY